MDGRIRKSLAHFALVLCIFPALAHAQAMGKVILDGAAEPAKVELAPPPIVPVAPPQVIPLPTIAATRPTVPDVARLAATAPPLQDASADPAIAVRKADEAPKPSIILPEVKLPDPPEAKAPATAPVLAAVAAATAPADAATKPSIENTPIRAAATAPAGTPAKPAATAASSFGGLAQVVTALTVVIGLILIGKAMAKKFVPGAKAGPAKGVIEILARHPLAKNQSIVLVRIGSQIVALNQGRESSESVLVINDATEVARIIGQIEGKSPDSISAGFNKLLANARMDLEQSPDEPELAGDGNLDEQLEEMAAAKRQLMELRQHVRSVRDRLPRE